MNHLKAYLNFKRLAEKYFYNEIKCNKFADKAAYHWYRMTREEKADTNIPAVICFYVCYLLFQYGLGTL